MFTNRHNAISWQFLVVLLYSPPSIEQTLIKYRRKRSLFPTVNPWVLEKNCKNSISQLTPVLWTIQPACELYFSNTIPPSSGLNDRNPWYGGTLTLKSWRLYNFKKTKNLRFSSLIYNLYNVPQDQNIWISNNRESENKRTPNTNLTVKNALCRENKWQNWINFFSGGWTGLLRF